MSIYKRIGSLILSLLLVFSMFGSTFAVQTFAATTTVLSVESKSVSSGEQFTVAVNLSNATSVYDGNFTLQYDSSLLTADSYSFGSIVSEHNKSCNLDYQSAGNLIRMTFYGTSSISANGTLVTITFTAKEDVSGTAALQFTNYKMYDLNGSSVTTTANGSNITITGEPVISPTISVANKTVTVGDTFSVPVLISDSESVYDGNFTLQYDSDLLTVNSYSYGSVVDSHNKNCNLDYQSSGNSIRFTFNGTSALSSDGTLVTFNFTAKSEGTAALKFTEYKMYDKNGISIATIATGNTIIIKPKSVVLSSISVNNMPTKTTYEIGELFDTTGLSIKLTYSNGSTSIIENGFTTSGFSSETAGTKVITVSYNGKSTTFNVTVNEPPSGNIAQGICGDNLTWVLDSSGVLTISGIGDMYNYYHQNYDGKTLPPWDEYSSSIKSVIICDGVTSIGNYAFYYCPCNDITLSKTVNSIGNYGISRCTSLEKITVEDSNPYYHSSGNCLIETESKTLVVGCKNSVIPTDNSVTKIGDGAFESCSGPYTLTIPSNITSIGENSFRWSSISNFKFNEGFVDIGAYAFYGSKKITSVNLPTTVKVIGDSAFASCEKLSSITLPNSTININYNSFSNTPYYNNTANWDNGVLYIGSHLIVAKSSITEHDVKDGTIDIAMLAFYGTALESVSIPDSVNKVGSRAFLSTPYYNNTANWEDDLLYIDNHLIAAKNTINGELKVRDYTKTISEYAFNECTNLKITIPYSVVDIGDRAFYKCNGIESITVDDGNSYYHSSGNCLIETSTGALILGCKNSVFPTDGSVKKIGVCAFYYCGFTTVTIPEGVTSIGQNAFYGCTSLKSLNIPKTVTEIGTSAFGYCISLESIKVTSGNTVYRSLGNCLIEIKTKTLLVGCKNSVIPNDGSVTKIANNAFSQVSGLESVIIPNNIVSIGNMAFYRCGSLKNITISKDVTNIAEDAFYYNSGIEKITVDAENKVYSSSGNCLIETETKTLILGCKNSVIPDDGTVTSIGEDAFYYCRALESLAIPDRVTSIERYAFSDCWNLKDITIPKSVTNIDDTAFRNCDNVVIYGYLDSFAQTYAENNDISFIALDGRNVTGVSIETSPEKTQYYIGDSLTIPGLKLMVSYSDGTTEIITNGFTTSGFSSTTAGTKTITVTYQGYTDTFTLTVKTPSVTLSSGSKTMLVGDTSSITATTTPSGQAVTWTSSNTSVATVSGGTITAKASGSTIITAKFTYNGTTYSKTCSVTVEDVPVPPTPESLSVSTKPTKTTYEIGESLNTSGLKLKLTYSDGTYETITSGFTTSGFSSTTTGTKTVTVKYSGLTTTFTVTVTSTPDPTPTSLSVSTKPTKTTYEIGESLNTSGLKLKLTYSDGSTETITSGFTTSGFSSTTAGTKTVTVKYSGLTTTFTVTVNVPEPDIDENAPQLVLDNKKVTVGKEFTVIVELKNNPGFNAASIKIEYDNNKLQLINAELSEAFSTGANVSYDNLPYLTFIRSNDVSDDAEFLILSFKALDVGDVKLSIVYEEGDISNSKEEDVNFVVVGGEITIAQYTPGDINDDGKVNTKDLTRLLKYINHENVEYNEQALDVNGDGKVNTKDLTRLLRYINRENVEIF